MLYMRLCPLRGYYSIAVLHGNLGTQVVLFSAGYDIIARRCRVQSCSEKIICCKRRDTRDYNRTLPGPRIRRHMAYTDQTLVCRDCNQEFIFTTGEQEFYASHSLTNTPSRCPSCRAARKAQSGGGYGSGRGSGPREARQMYTTTCSNCGNEAQVPFQPRGDKPVYCSDCYQTMSPASGRSSDRRSRW